MRKQIRVFTYSYAVFVILKKLHAVRRIGKLREDGPATNGGGDSGVGVTGFDTAYKLLPPVPSLIWVTASVLRNSNIPVMISLTYNLTTVGIAALLMVRSTIS